MSDDMLERATRALSARYTPENAALGGERGLRRLEQSLSPRRQPSRGRVVALIVAASFVALTAWASVSGHLPRWLRIPAVDSASLPEPVGTGVADLPNSPTPPLPPAQSDPPAGEEVAPVVPSSSASPKARPRASAVVPVPTRPQVAPLTDLDALYREAHEAHFVRHDPMAALAAWNRYIAAAGPDGRMILEARYNRAMALVRLGKNDEAKEALEPFARGEFGGYRREEATRLLDSLR